MSLKIFCGSRNNWLGALHGRAALGQSRRSEDVPGASAQTQLPDQQGGGRPFRVGPSGDVQAHRVAIPDGMRGISRDGGSGWDVRLEYHETETDARAWHIDCIVILGLSRRRQATNCAAWPTIGRQCNDGPVVQRAPVGSLIWSDTNLFQRQPDGSFRMRRICPLFPPFLDQGLH
jgi:hypothetical protein